ncbi:hypothetical protein PTSG_05644 [Salpingoeca rosetta]|uniref:Uncharacterized protein n=1 Tax=Salpingoeca rosetta (strain ATCC 50818 / BSB-021) TaxID=946362 RepID=F2UBT3_SALR5|nr:uncharacterized protein PTSG_05644 [Salpingoeca rosetta]EGD73949.1 hypothetical protein PTSG_05644 [Salpingoeca rosetta]|eukprot:XP_004993512.1 hypothetical protein PTSG_05644 [Salpingoeca rosetta]
MASARTVVFVSSPLQQQTSAAWFVQALAELKNVIKLHAWWQSACFWQFSSNGKTSTGWLSSDEAVDVLTRITELDHSSWAHFPALHTSPTLVPASIEAFSNLYVFADTLQQHVQQVASSALTALEEPEQSELVLLHAEGSNVAALIAEDAGGTGMDTDGDLTLPEDFAVKHVAASRHTLSMFFRQWWQPSSALAHRQACITLANEVQVQCDLQPVVLDPVANIPGPYGAHFQLSMKPRRMRAHALVDDAAASEPADLQFVARAQVASVTSALLFGTTFILKPTTLPSLSWVKLKEHSQRFEALARRLQTEGTKLVLEKQCDFGLASYFVVFPAVEPSHLSSSSQPPPPVLWLKAVASRELMNHVDTAWGIDPTDTQQQQDTAIASAIHTALTEVPSLGRFNPLDFESHLFAALPSGPRRSSGHASTAKRRSDDHANHSSVDHDISVSGSTDSTTTTSSSKGGGGSGRSGHSASSSKAQSSSSSSRAVPSQRRSRRTRRSKSAKQTMLPFLDSTAL